jgi:hypothetical protein
VSEDLFRRQPAHTLFGVGMAQAIRSRPEGCLDLAVACGLRLPLELARLRERLLRGQLAHLGHGQDRLGPRRRALAFCGSLIRGLFPLLKAGRIRCDSYARDVADRVRLQLRDRRLFGLELAKLYVPGLLRVCCPRNMPRPASEVRNLGVRELQRLLQPGAELLVRPQPLASERLRLRRQIAAVGADIAADRAYVDRAVLQGPNRGDAFDDRALEVAAFPRVGEQRTLVLDHDLVQRDCGLRLLNRRVGLAVALDDAGDGDRAVSVLRAPDRGAAVMRQGREFLLALAFGEVLDLSLAAPAHRLAERLVDIGDVLDVARLHDARVLLRRLAIERVDLLGGVLAGHIRLLGLAVEAVGVFGLPCLAGTLGALGKARGGVDALLRQRGAGEDCCCALSRDPSSASRCAEGRAAAGDLEYGEERVLVDSLARLAELPLDRESDRIVFLDRLDELAAVAGRYGRARVVRRVDHIAGERDEVTNGGADRVADLAFGHEAGRTLSGQRRRGRGGVHERSRHARRVIDPPVLLLEPVRLATRQDIEARAVLVDRDRNDLAALAPELVGLRLVERQAGPAELLRQREGVAFLAVVEELVPLLSLPECLVVRLRDRDSVAVAKRAEGTDAMLERHLRVRPDLRQPPDLRSGVELLVGLLDRSLGRDLRIRRARLKLGDVLEGDLRGAARSLLLALALDLDVGLLLGGLKPVGERGLLARDDPPRIRNLLAGGHPAAGLAH